MNRKYITDSFLGVRLELVLLFFLEYCTCIASMIYLEEFSLEEFTALACVKQLMGKLTNTFKEM